METHGDGSGARGGLGHHAVRPPAGPSMRGDRGMVTFEVALAIPLVFLACLAAAWVLRLGQVQAQLQDAARAAVREVARGASEAVAESAADQVLPGVRLGFADRGDAVAVNAEYTVDSPAPALRGLDRELQAQATALSEVRDDG
jgi:TadE-like protein